MPIVLADAESRRWSTPRHRAIERSERLRAAAQSRNERWWASRNIAGLRLTWCDRPIGDQGYDDELQTDQCAGRRPDDHVEVSPILIVMSCRPILGKLSQSSTPVSVSGR